MNDIYKLGNTTGVCSAAAVEEMRKLNKDSVTPGLSFDFLGALFLDNGEEVPKDSSAAESAGTQFETVYFYFWISLTVVLLCSMVFLQLVRKKRRADLFDWVGMTTRSLGCVVCITLFSLAFTKDGDSEIRLLFGPYIVPIAVFILFGVLCGDQISRVLCNWRLKRKGLLMDEELKGYEHQHEHSDQSLEEHPQYVGLIGHENTSAQSTQH
jgi:hypothetical protein